MCDCEAEVIPQCVLWWAARGGGPGSYWAPREPAASVGLLPDHSTTWDHLRPAGSHSRAGWPDTCTGVWRQPVEHKHAFRGIWHCGFWNCIQKYSLPSHHYPYIMSAVQRQGTVDLKQVMLRLKKALQILRMEPHHQGDVVKATEHCEGVLKNRLCSFIQFSDLKYLGQQGNKDEVNLGNSALAKYLH